MTNFEAGGDRRAPFRHSGFVINSPFELRHSHLISPSLRLRDRDLARRFFPPSGAMD